MLKKRIIITLLYDQGNFMLSRNFRLQRVGNLNWLKNNSDISKISFFIDELIVLNVSRNNRDNTKFAEDLKLIATDIFVPIAAGGGINSIECARQLFNSGADKVVINSSLFRKPSLLNELTERFGQQSIVASIDIKKIDNSYKIVINSGNDVLKENINTLFNLINQKNIGECYVNSIDRDGTCQGYDLNILNLIPSNWSIPVILSGGAGNYKHFIEGLRDSRVDAVSTAHLFNFVGDGLKKSRESILLNGIDLAYWPKLDELKIF